MKKIPLLVLALAAVVIIAVARIATVRAQEPQPAEQGTLLPGCDVPKSYGHLVTVMPGNNAGLAGQAVFEAEDGTIRWVPMMYNSQQAIVQKPARRPMPANFPILPLYECAVGHVWKRP